MEKLFIPYELALIAKERGFNEPCIADFYNKELYLLDRVKGYDTHSNDYFNKCQVAAPTYQQILDWLRENHHMVVYCYPSHQTYSGCIIRYRAQLKQQLKPTYYEALNAAIKEAFSLISII